MKIGDTVKLNKNKVTIHKYPEGCENNATAKIISFMSEELYGKGAIMLDRDLYGCQFWNESNLVKTNS